MAIWILYQCLSLIGYCLLRIVIISALSLFVPQGGVAVLILVGIFVVWWMRVCTRIMVEVAGCDEYRGLVGYACFLIYMQFSLLITF